MVRSALKNEDFHRKVQILQGSFTRKFVFYVKSFTDMWWLKIDHFKELFLL